MKLRISTRGIRVSGRTARTLSALALTLAAVGAGVAGATSASADATVHTIAQATTAYAPYLSSQDGGMAANIYFSISCYLTGDNVSGPYGTENVWDLISSPYGTPYVNSGPFIPDGDVYPGSNSPVVPRCPTVALETIIGGNPVNVLSAPGSGSPVDTLPVGERIAIKCYTTSSTWVSGPYGSENVWDQLSAGNGWMPFGTPGWVPDALLYTGSNSAVVPHC